jgi:hypothetical protein
MTIHATAEINTRKYRLCSEGKGKARSYTIQSEHVVNGEQEWETIAAADIGGLAIRTWAAILIADRRGRT